MKLTEIKDAGLANDEIRKQLEETATNLKSNKQRLSRLINDAARQSKRRKEMKYLISDLSKQSHENNKRLKQFTHNRPGKPALEVHCLNLHKAIVAIATAGAGANSGRRTENLDACVTLDDLRDCLIKDGYERSRSPLYLRLLPRRQYTIEGKKDVKTVPVKISCVKKILRKKHADANFIFATKEYLKNTAIMFGPDYVLILSIDDKVKVPIGITAAAKQTPVVMHMAYEIRLPAHDFVVATTHKLTPSVYAAYEITKSSSKGDFNILYSGPMHIVIRSGKHDSSTASTHGRDSDKLLDEFDNVARNNGQVKPLVISFVVGGPDENLRFPKTLDIAIDHIK